MIALRAPTLNLASGSVISVVLGSMIISPCEKICAVDSLSGLCVGCGRNLSEIERWARMSDGERVRIMTELPQRLETMRTRKSGSTAN